MIAGETESGVKFTAGIIKTRNAFGENYSLEIAFNHVNYEKIYRDELNPVYVYDFIEYAGAISDHLQAIDLYSNTNAIFRMNKLDRNISEKFTFDDSTRIMFMIREHYKNVFQNVWGKHLEICKSCFGH